MSSFRNAILGTLAYYDTFGMPLTVLEIHTFLINPGRFQVDKKPIDEITLANISYELDSLCKINVINEKNGMYFFIGRENIYDIRLARQLIATKKWKKFIRYSRYLQIVPYLRGIFGSGSMALSHTTTEADFDVLVIIKFGRLYTGRLVLWLLTSILGIRRGKYDTIAVNKLCFNHYITDASLAINHESLYNAQTYSHLVPVIMPSELYDRFYVENGWINRYVYHFKPSADMPKRRISEKGFLKNIARMGEFILDSFLGDIIEKLARWHQQKRIKSTPATYESGGRVVFNDRELEFHPASFEKFVVERYNQKLKELGVVPFIEEKDSGLLTKD